MITKELINSEVEKLRKELLAKLEEPKFEVDKWYKRSDGAMINVQELHPRPKGYGITSLGSWAEELEMCETKAFTIATTSEVQSALEAEAVKRGFIKGAMVKPLQSCDGDMADNIGSIITEGFLYRETKNQLVKSLQNNMYNSVIFDNGLWATIIKEKTSEEWANEYEDKHFKTTSLHNFLVINNLKITKK